MNEGTMNKGIAAIACPRSIADFSGHLEWITAGKSGMVYGIDGGRVIKEYYGGEEEGEIDVERRAFERLGSHANIVTLLGALEDRCILLERGQPVRAMLQRPEHIPIDTKIRWVKEAAEGIRYIHQSGIVHSDVGCNNMIIVHDRLKIIDFEGCSIDGEQSTSGYEWFSYRESIPRISQQTDIFAYGCAVYEIMTGRQPYYEYIGTRESREIPITLYANNQFPDVSQVALGQVIQGCWTGSFHTMSDVIEALELAAKLTIRSRYTITHWGFYLRDVAVRFFGTFWTRLWSFWRSRITRNESQC